MLLWVLLFETFFKGRGQSRVLNFVLFSGTYQRKAANLMIEISHKGEGYIKSLRVRKSVEKKNKKQNKEDGEEAT